MTGSEVLLPAQTFVINDFDYNLTPYTCAELEASTLYPTAQF